MIRISIEVPDHCRYRLKPIVDLRHRFLQSGILVGFGLKGADLRILHQDAAAKELEASRADRLSTPVIVDERIDGAHVIYETRIRNLMAHPDVKFWLKRNTYRDFQRNNLPFIETQYHYQLINDIPGFDGGGLPRSPGLPVTAEMAGKIRLLPTAVCDLFAYFREQKIDWSTRRRIDVNFIGLVNYEGRNQDLWDGRLKEVAAEAAKMKSAGHLPGLHRRAAVLQLARLEHLRVLIGMNRAVDPELYRMSMMRSSISVSPWGLGEYAYRDYESILAGCVMVKPLTDHVETFAPDIYQAGKYYIPCRPDFADLPEVIESIMSDRERAIGLARRARENLLAANAPDRIHAYYLHLFKQALGEQKMQQASEWRFSAPPILALDRSRLVPYRAQISREPAAPGLTGTATSIVVTEDRTTQNTHDIRLFGDQPALPGLYRLRFAVRRRGRSRIAMQLHADFKDQGWLDVDLQSLDVRRLEAMGSLFKVAYGPEFARVGDGWIVGAVAVHLTAFLEKGPGVVLYLLAETSRPAYDGDGRIGLEVAALDFGRISMPSEERGVP